MRALMQVVDDQLFILGKPVEQLEQAVAELSHTRYAVGCASGTDALLLALRALDIGRGDEVVTTPFTFFATAGTIHNVGATPVFVDIEPSTFNIATEQAAAAVTARTKAVVPVDLFGQMAPIEAPGMLGNSNIGMAELGCASSISTSLSSSSPSRNFLRNASRVVGEALAPTSALSSRSSAARWARACSALRFSLRTMAMATSTRSRTICSTSRPT